jgi:hypothetical protein
MANNPKHKENLKPFPKGNKFGTGRPKKLPALDLIMANVLGAEKDGISAGEAIIMKLREQALKGDIKAAQILLDRGWGKPKQNIDITTQGEKVTVPTIIFTKDKANK